MVRLIVLFKELEFGVSCTKCHYVLNTFWRSCPNLVEAIMSMFDTCNMSLLVQSISSWPAGTARIAHEICVDVTAIDKMQPEADET